MARRRSEQLVLSQVNRHGWEVIGEKKRPYKRGFDGRLGLGVFVGVAAQEEHGEAEDQHDDAPDKVDVHACGAKVDVAAAGGEAVDREHDADNQEHQTEGNAEIKAHGVRPFLIQKYLLTSFYLKMKLRPMSRTMRPTAI